MERAVIDLPEQRLHDLEVRYGVVRHAPWRWEVPGGAIWAGPYTDEQVISGARRTEYQLVLEWIAECRDARKTSVAPVPLAFPNPYVEPGKSVSVLIRVPRECIYVPQQLVVAGAAPHVFVSKAHAGGNRLFPGPNDVCTLALSNHARCELVPALVEGEAIVVELQNEGAYPWRANLWTVGVLERWQGLHRPARSLPEAN